MAYVDPYTWQVMGGGLMSPYTAYADPYSQAVQGMPTQSDVVAQGLPSTYGSAEAGMMSAAPSSGATMSPEAQARAMSALGQRGKPMALGAGKRAVAAGLAGADLGQALGAGIQGAMTPGSIAGLATAPAYAAYGVAPETTFGKMVGTGLQAASGLMGPFGGVLGALGASPLASALEDALDMRAAEVDKDVVEDVKGFFGGRSTVADALTGQKNVAGTYGDVDTSFAEAANKAVDKLGTDYGAPRGTGTGLTEAGRRAYQKQAIADINAYQRAQLAAKQARAQQAWGRSKFGGGDQSAGTAGRGGTADSDVGGAAGGYGGGGGSGMGSAGSGMGRGR